MVDWEYADTVLRVDDRDAAAFNFPLGEARSTCAVVSCAVVSCIAVLSCTIASLGSTDS